MTSRYDSRQIGINKTDQYQSLLDSRSVNHIRQYFTPELFHPTDIDMSTLQLVGHVWSHGDRYFKLANKYYGDSKLWWIIAWFNQAPTESDLDLGQSINIPLPLDKILGILGV